MHGRVTTYWHQTRPRRRPGDGTRRGSVLVLVMAILGVLFVTGITFLVTMEFEARLVESERQTGQEDVGVDLIQQESGDRFKIGFIAEPGQVGGDDPISDYVFNNVTSEYEVHIGSLSWAELPLVHGVISQVEPIQDPDSGDYLFLYGTDLITQSTGVFNMAAWYRGQINTYLPTELPDPTSVPDLTLDADAWGRVDADGDGVVDARQYDASLMGYTPSQVRELSKAVNPSTNPTGEVYIGLRIIPHGAMVDLDDAHPRMIDEVMDPDRGIVPVNTIGHRPYSPVIEESSLRRRFLLPPRVIPVTAAQGNPADPADDPPGGGDFGVQLFSPDQSVWTGEHRYWPYTHGTDDATWYSEWEDWVTRSWSQPYDGANDPNHGGANYDRRHLVTTISHDDNLSRPVTVARKPDAGSPAEAEDVLDLMIEATRSDYDRLNSSICINTGSLRFQRVAYPHTLASGYLPAGDEPSGVLTPDGDAYGDPYVWCKCEHPDSNCEHDPRKGKLRLSLPWLDKMTQAMRDVRSCTRTADKPILDFPLAETTPTDSACANNRELTNLIQETFAMLLLNARTEATNIPSLGAFVDDDDPVDGVNDRWRPDWKGLSRTAASLTANMIDFADADHEPTRVEVRYFDFGADAADLDLSGSNAKDWENDIWLKMLGKSTCDPTITGLLDNEGIPIACEYVYGLEQQPYITEIAAKIEDSNDDGVAEVEAFAIELFNPYEEALDLGKVREEYYLQVEGITPMLILLDEITVQPGGYAVLASDLGAFGLADDGTTQVDANLSLDAATTVYLLRTNPYETYNRDAPNNPIVVDQFAVATAVSGAILSPGLTEEEFVVERPFVDHRADDDQPYSRWFAPVPVDAALPVRAFHTLGDDNDAIGSNERRVEVVFADSGSFSSAFPTTGSMLLLMRHANRSRDFNNGGATKLAFTSYLRGSGTPDVSSDLDNGRMPVFDEHTRFHVDPKVTPYQYKDPPNSGNLKNEWPKYRPGETMHLPWGQLVFDYFTALPLSNPGPFDGLQPGETVAEDVQPRVDQEGLRVHGRMNVNAAPWRTLVGVPMLPMADIQNDVVKGKWRLALQDDDSRECGTDGEACKLGGKLARAIVAYREAREVNVEDYGSGTTGDYGDFTDTGPPLQEVRRAWDVDAPTLRRGTGFLTVGEMANVRHGAADDAYRFDSGQLALASEYGSYLKAIAVLGAMGDWVTVRSHVFTVYGTVRGAVDPSIEGDTPEMAEAQRRLADIDSRALRFQETVDRLPTYLGAKSVKRIGDRTVAPYLDAMND